MGDFLTKVMVFLNDVSDGMVLRRWKIHLYRGNLGGLVTQVCKLISANHLTTMNIVNIKLVFFNVFQKALIKKSATTFLNSNLKM